MNYYTHSGRFHADEVLGYVICKMANFCHSYTRLTDLENIPQDGLIADIGREWNPKEWKFDHHQGFFARENGVPYASAGMLWRQFGDTITQDQEVSNRVDEVFIQGIDAHDADNSYSCVATCSAGEVRTMTISAIVASYNYKDVKNEMMQSERFEEAILLLETSLRYAISSARDYIEGARKFKSIVQEEGNILTLSEYVPWQEIVEKDYPDALYIITPSGHPGNPVSLTAVPVKAGSRELKKPIERPEWFDNFIHQGKWIAGCDSLEQAQKLAKAQV